MDPDVAGSAHTWTHCSAEAAPHTDRPAAASMATSATWSGERGSTNDDCSADQRLYDVEEHEMPPFLQRLACSEDSTRRMAPLLPIIHLAYSFCRWAVPSRRQATNRSSKPIAGVCFPPLSDVACVHRRRTCRLAVPRSDDIDESR